MLTDILYSNPVKCIIFLMFICYGSRDFASLDCNFDNGLCNWQQETTDDFEWYRKSGDTWSEDTGPMSDHTTGDGYYIYIEASGKHEGDTAVISSPVQESGPYCLTFWYNMYGRNIGALNVYMILNDGNRTLLLTKDENNGNNDWRKAVINNNAKDKYWIVFEGVRGDDSKGDIAVDDISMKRTLCSLDLASLDCNFEDGLCNWQQKNSDDFDWLRKSGATRSLKTGPSTDHTTGDDGHYIYIEASDQEEGDKAAISSPVQESGPFCLTFWYNMYGRDIGALNVYMILNDGSTTSLLTKNENHGNDDWRKAVINNNAKDAYSIVFEGMRGDDSKGDIAVDDISMTRTLCSLDLGTLDCNFEDGLCNWLQENSDDFDWLRESGATQSSNTGPRSDHTTGENGYYLYIEANDQYKGAKAVISSPVQESGPFCLTFWYNMFGRHIGVLNVYVILNGSNTRLLLTKDRNHGHNDWRKAVINHNATGIYKIVFEGVRGDGTNGDIAVDDISMIRGLCSLDCDYDEGFCNWMHDDGDNFDWKLGKGPTATSDTGSEADHTTGNGQYAYIDSSEGSKGSVAWLVSPVQNAGKYCFSFWYFMYGIDVDSLMVWQVYGNGTEQNLFIGNGNKGENWLRKQIFIHNTTPIKIIFEGKVFDKRMSWTRDNGDIAVDDVQIVSCQDCKNPIPQNATANSTNFEYGSVIEITCNVGYTFIGVSPIVCQTGGSWSAPQPACKLFDCGIPTISDGKFNAAKGTTFGQTATYMCNIGYTLVGDMTVYCTATGWSNTNASCEIVDAENDALIAVYVIVPVIIVVLAILLTIFILRKRFPNCKKASESKDESHKNPKIAAADNTYNGLALESQHHINPAYEDRSLDGNDEYATISNEQNVNLNQLYYNIGGPEGTSTEHDVHNYDHTNDTAATHFVNESYSHISRKKSDMMLESNDNTTKHMDSGKASLRTQAQSDTNSYDFLNIKHLKEAAKHRKELEDGKECDYDHAHAGDIDPVAIDKDDYSHLNDVNINKKYPASFSSGNDDGTEYSYTNAHSARKGKDVQKSKVGYEQKSIPASQHELQDTNIDDRHYFVLEAEEVRDDNYESENHDYFVLEKTDC